MTHHDTIAGFALLAICAFVFWLTLGFSEPPSMLSQNVPPTFFPRLVLSAIALMSALLILLGLRKKRVPGSPIPAVVWVTACFIVIAGALMTYLGTLVTLSLVGLILPRIWGERRWHLIVALAIGLPAGIYVVFSVLLDVRFPLGRIFELFA